MRAPEAHASSTPDGSPLTPIAQTGVTHEQAEEAFVSRAALHSMLTEDEVAAALISMLHMPGLCAADIHLSAGMLAPRPCGDQPHTVRAVPQTVSSKNSGRR